jgi:HK97 gp10 family phage protein
MGKTFVAGLDQLGERMRTLEPKRAIGACVSATGAAARLVKEAAKDNVRRSPSIETGSLLDAVIVKKMPKSQTSLTSEHIVTVRGRGKPANKKGQKIARAPHAHYVEEGTVKMPAEPFLRPALDRNIGKAVDVMVERLDRRLIREGR